MAPTLVGFPVNTRLFPQDLGPKAGFSLHGFCHRVKPLRQAAKEACATHELEFVRWGSHEYSLKRLLTHVGFAPLPQWPSAIC